MRGNLEMGSNRFALIIANDQYEDDSLSALQAPKLDANALAKVLANPETCNFHVQILVNENTYKINQIIETFFNDRRRDDLLLLYFSGHGIKDEDGKLYFATPDTNKKTLRTTSIAASLVNDFMRRTRSRSQVLLLDCCYSGAFAKGMLAKSESAVGSSIGTNEYFQGRGRVVLTASDSMQYAFEEDDLVEEGAVNSIFTSAIVDGIKSWKADRDNNNRISITELYDYVDGYIYERTPNQRPSIWSFETQGEIIIAEREYVSELGHEEIQSSVELEQPVVDIEPVVESGQKFPLKPVIFVVFILVTIIGIGFWSGIIPFNSITDDGGGTPSENVGTSTSESGRTSSWEITLISKWGTTSPSFDGIINEDEWEDASQYNITLYHYWGEITSIEQYQKDATIYLKNDADFLYLALTIYDMYYRMQWINFYFDHHDNGVIDTYEDMITSDFHIEKPNTYQSFSDGVIYIDKSPTFDDLVGGTLDAFGKFSHSNPQFDEKGTLYLEIARPLDSNDEMDVRLEPGSRVGFGIRVWDFPSAEVMYSWPNGFDDVENWDKINTLILAQNP